MLGISSSISLYTFPYTHLYHFTIPFFVYYVSVSPQQMVNYVHLAFFFKLLSPNYFCNFVSLFAVFLLIT